MSKVNEFIGMDLSTEELILSCLKASGKKKEFIGLRHYPCQGVSEDEMAKMITQVLKDFKVKNPYIVNVIPLHLAITKNLEIPSLDAREIKEIVDLQSGRQTPYSREEIIVDYINIGIYRQSYTKIILVIVARSAIKRQLDIMQKAGLKVEKMVFAPEGISQVCTAKIRKELQSLPLGIVHVDSNFTDFIVSLRGNLVFTRSIPIGIKHFISDR